MPVIVTDADGVLYRGGLLIPGVADSFRKYHNKSLGELFTDQYPTDTKKTFQMYCLTNGGGKSEDYKAGSINKSIGLAPEEDCGFEGE